VFGPSTGGGYYLLGLKTAHRRLFEGITWGTERVAAQTLERARELKLEVHMLPASILTMSKVCAGCTAN
jgi:glycosyltransferase A (GT-A) superfamily protein (DUF2064 family)